MPFFFGSERQLSVGGVLNCGQLHLRGLAHVGGAPVADIEDALLGSDRAVAEANVGGLVAPDDVRPALLKHEREFCCQLASASQTYLPAR